MIGTGVFSLLVLIGFLYLAHRCNNNDDIEGMFISFGFALASFLSCMGYLVKGW